MNLGTNMMGLLGQPAGAMVEERARFTRGKFRGEYMDEVAKVFPKYIVWCYETVASRMEIPLKLYRSCIGRVSPVGFETTPVARRLQKREPVGVARENGYADQAHKAQRQADKAQGHGSLYIDGVKVGQITNLVMDKGDARDEARRMIESYRRQHPMCRSVPFRIETDFQTGLTMTYETVASRMEIPAEETSFLDELPDTTEVSFTDGLFL